MNTKQIVQYFNQHGYKLRPDAYNLLKDVLTQDTYQEQKLFLKEILGHINKIFLDKKNITSSIIEKDVLKEAIVFSTYKDEMIIEDDKEADAFDHCLLILDNFQDFQLFTQNRNENLIQQKFEFFQHLIKNSSQYYYDHDSEKNLNANAVKLTNIGQMKGKEGNYNLMGVVFQKFNKLYLQDTVTNIKLNIDNCSQCDFYFSEGHIVVVKGRSSKSIFYVDKIECLNIPIKCNVSLIEKYKQIFYDNFTKEKHLQNCYQKYFNFKEDNIKEQSHYVTIFSNFYFSQKNFDLLEKYLCLKMQGPPLMIVLMGSFFNFQPINSTQKMEKMKRLTKQFRDLLKHYKELLYNTKIFVVPSTLDEGMHILPRKEISEFVIRYIIEQNKNFYLAQNPFNFCCKSKTFSILRQDQITINLRNSLIKQQVLEPYQLMVQTILGQREYLPNQGHQIMKFQNAFETLFIKDLPNFVILGENCSPENIYQNDKSNIVFCSNFDLTNQYTEINLIDNKIKFGNIEQLYLSNKFKKKQKCVKIRKLMIFQKIQKINKI